MAAAHGHSPFTPPVVDSLAIRVVVDSFYERFLPPAEHEQCDIEHLRRVPGRQMTTLACEWGLSLHLESKSGGDTAQYVLDFGYTPEIIGRNFDLLDIDPKKINGLILSHGHRDHYGGMAGFVTQYRSRMRDDVSLFVGGEDVFLEKWVKEGTGEDPFISWGKLDRTHLVAQNVKPVCCHEPHVFDACGAFSSGYIDRTSFEEVSGGTMIEDPEEEYVEDHFTGEERRGKRVKDLHPGEHATCYIVKSKGLVVISSCGHTGIINTVKTAMAVTNTQKVHAIVGGFHLGPAPLDYVDHTIDELEAMKPDVVVPMHCTGTNFIERMRTRMPDQLVTSNVGSRFTFGV
jgi:7,8-dihydropterin-6-yl-methyl-4-(beta-D-ribofuranosyl)aminobenzene 5'-phosphate synthase